VLSPAPWLFWGDGGMSVSGRNKGRTFICFTKLDLSFLARCPCKGSVGSSRLIKSELMALSRRVFKVLGVEERNGRERQASEFSIDDFSALINCQN